MDGTLRLAIQFAEDHPGEAARLLETVAPADAVSLLEGLADESAAEILSRMAPVLAANVLRRLEASSWPILVPLMPTRHIVAMLHHMSGEDRLRVLGSQAEALADRVRRLLRYPRGSVGTIMDPSISAVPFDLTVAEAGNIDTDPGIPYLYVVDRDQKLVGVIHRRELAAAPTESSLSSLMTSTLERLPANSQVEAIREHDAWREFEALPVVGADGHFLGVVRHKSLRSRERKAASIGGQRPPLATVLDLGELYWTGLSSLVNAMATELNAEDGGGEPDDR